MLPTSESFLTGSNIDFIEAQYARFLADPASVDPSFHELFGALVIRPRRADIWAAYHAGGP